MAFYPYFKVDPLDYRNKPPKPQSAFDFLTTLSEGGLEILDESWTQAQSKDACRMASNALKMHPYTNDNIYRKKQMDFQALKNMDVKGKVVLLRADLNVPAEGGKITDMPVQ